MDMTRVSFFIGFAAIVLSSAHPSAFGANQPRNEDASNQNLFADLRDSDVLSPHIADQHPKSAGRPIAPSPPKMASRSEPSSASYNLKTTDDVPQHMKDFHSRVLEHIHASAEVQDDNELASMATSEYMLTLYRHQENDAKNLHRSSGVNHKQGNALKRSDIVRSFNAIGKCYKNYRNVKQMKSQRR